MDDIIDKNQQLPQPNKYVRQACERIELEEKLVRQAEMRGVDKKLLKSTAPKITLLTRCIRSMYTKTCKNKKTDLK